MNEKDKIEKPEKKQKKHVKASLVQTPSPAKNYAEPPLNKVITKITPDPYQPQMGEVASDLVANLSAGTVLIPHRGMATIDCGFSMEVKSGYKVRFVASDELMARGGYISLVKTGNFRVAVTVMNLGRENPLMIRHGDKFATMFVEPIYLFEFVS